MSTSHREDIEALERRIELIFSNKELLKLALTDSSSVSEPRKRRSRSNDQLATLGDSVLNLTVAAHLYKKSQGSTAYSTSAVGDLTIGRSELVNNKRLAQLARQAALGDFITRSAYVDQIGIGVKILSRAYEALIGAIYLDAGFEKATEFVNRFVIQLDH
jgi:ribonuclease-3